MKKFLILLFLCSTLYAQPPIPVRHKEFSSKPQPAATIYRNETKGNNNNHPGWEQGTHNPHKPNRIAPIKTATGLLLGLATMYCIINMYRNVKRKESK